jgi:hypothetical protein
MNRPVYLGLLVVAVVAAAGLGTLDAGTGERTGTGMGVGMEARAEGGDTETGESAPVVEPAPGLTTGARTATSAARADDSGTDPGSASSLPYPPGTTAEGIEHPSRLLGAHTNGLAETGFILRSSVNATVLETGMRIDATARGGARVASDASEYYAHRSDAAGPLERRTEDWYSGGVEHRRRIGKFGGVQESTQQARSVGELAGRPLLAPHLRSGAFEAATVRRIGGETLFVFAASGLGNESAIETGLPEASTDIRSYNGRLVVDSMGRIRSLTARVRYVIGGKPATYRLDYDLLRLGNASVERPKWA